MRRIFILLIVALMFGIGLGVWKYSAFYLQDQSVPKSGEGDGGKEKAGIIRLSEGAMRSAGIVIEGVGKRRINNYITTTGEVKANIEREAHVTSRIPGRVVEVKARLGDDVSKGEVLALIDSVEVEQIKIGLIGEIAKLRATETNLQKERLLYGNKSKIAEMAKKGIKSEDAINFLKDAELGKAKADILKPLTRLELAESNLKREKELYKDNISSMKEVIAAEKGYTAARIEFQTAVEEMFLNAKQEIIKAEADWTSAKGEIEKMKGSLHLYGFSNEEIERMTTVSERHEYAPIPITSPFNGRIVEKKVAMGEVIDTSTPLFKLIDLSTVWVWANVYERDIGRVKNGEETFITVTPYPDRVFTGKITYISDTVDPATRIVKVRVEVDNPPSHPFRGGDRWEVKGGQGGLLKPEMFATIKINVGQGESLAVPESAIQRDGENTIVFVALSKEGEFEKRVVTVGSEVDGYHPILSGLEEGERIVTKGSFILKSESLKGLMEEE